MLTIDCHPSPFVFTPLINLLTKLGYQPKTKRDYLCMCLLDPLNKKHWQYKTDSHLTDAQIQQHPDELGALDQRHLGLLEVKRKLMYIAHRLIPYLQDKKLVFKASANCQSIPQLLLFIHYLQLQGKVKVSIEFGQIDTMPVYTCKATQEITKLYFTDQETRKQHASTLLQTAKDCILAEDYYSALNLLNALKDISFKTKEFEIEVYIQLATYYQIIGTTEQAEFYWKLCLESGNLMQRNTASYGLSMLYLRHHPKKWLNIEKGGDYLEAIYPELFKKPDSKKFQAKRIFNRNGYALVLFKQGKIEEAQKLIEQGIDFFDKEVVTYDKFRQSILYYNFFQCLVAKKQFAQAEKTMQDLIGMDPKFFAYYEFLAEFYVKTHQLDKAIATLRQGLVVDDTYFKFYYLLGKCAHLQKDYETAIIHFQQAYSLNPLDRSSLCYLTTLHNQAKQYTTVLELLKYFDLKSHNHAVGELIFNNYIIACLNTKMYIGDLKSLVGYALTLRPSSALFKKIDQGLNKPA